MRLRLPVQAGQIVGKGAKLILRYRTKLCVSVIGVRWRTCFVSSRQALRKCLPTAEEVDERLEVVLQRMDAVIERS